MMVFFSLKGQRHRVLVRASRERACRFVEERLSPDRTRGHPRSHAGTLGRRGGPRGCACGGEMGPHGPPQAPIFQGFLFSAIFYLFSWEFGDLRPCYHALRQPVGDADRAMMHN